MHGYGEYIDRIDWYRDTPWNTYSLPLLALTGWALMERQVTAPQAALKYLALNHNATFTRLIRTGTSINGPMTAANA